MLDYNKIVSKKAREMKPSGIRRFFDLAATMEDVITLGIGEPDFQTPWSIRRAAITALEKGKTFYTANSGLAKLREVISGYLKKTIHVEYNPADEIIVTVGGSEAIDLAIRAIVEPGDEVLVVEPSFVCYSPLVELCGGVAVPLITKRENLFRLTADELAAKITDKTKLLVLPYPNNPTGAVMRRDDLEKLAEVLKDTNVIVLSDEIYCELTYGGQKHVSIAEIPGMRERTLVVNGFSKSYAMTGWRLGYVSGPKEIIKHMLKIHQYGIMCSPTISQYAASEAMENCEGDVRMMVEEYDRRRRFVVDGFNNLGLDCFEPEGAFYVFPCIKSLGMTSEEFCEELLQKKHVAVIPGNAFGDCGEGFIRVSYAYSLKHLKEALSRIREFIDEFNADEKS